ncbi:MAG: redoxin domain-containing protein [Bacteroidales bacterium]
MKAFLLIITGILLSFQLSAQRPVYGPDFGLVDESGDTLYLYDDLLDQGKTVVLAFFGHSCPSCIEAVPELNNIYNDYGQNTEDVYLWAIEPNQYYDYDDMNQFESDHGTDYQCWTTTDTDSVSGLYDAYYTPRYYVICPDGSMRDWDLEDVPGAIDYCLLNTIDKEVTQQPELIVQHNAFFLKSSDRSEYNLKIFAVDGQLMLKDKIRPNARINLNLPAGMYIYLITDNNGKQYAGRFIY